ncbi:MAG: phosphonate ABC transporter, permease protein PhnE [Pseudomonadota bacterium]
MSADVTTGTAVPSSGPASIMARLADANKVARRRFWVTMGVLAIISAYMAGTFYQFDLGNLARKWSPTKASLFLLDTYAHKDHVSIRWKTPDKVRIAFEGGYREIYATPPKWYTRDEQARSHTVRFDNGGRMIVFPDRVEMRDWPKTTQPFIFKVNAEGKPYVEGFVGRTQALPSWIRQTENKVEVRPSLYERLQVYGSSLEIHRYEIGWKYFWFDFDSPLVGKSVLEAVGLMFSGERIDPERSNASLVLNEFLENDQWHHGVVLYAMVETILMAILGTLLACLVGLPLAFLAAANVTPFAAVRFALRRLFDFLRGVDMLIWSLIFLRAFGPGLFTGIFAIAFTDTGTFGKLMSEAIENADNKQREGVQSTGATKVQQHRFGIIPQILPIFISQSLYYLESNTRGAVIIGAMGAGGIGLQFLGALQTGNDFENVGYMALLVLVTVTLMDMMSAKLRRLLIGIDAKQPAAKRRQTAHLPRPKPQGV